MDNFIVVNLTLFSLDQFIFVNHDGKVDSKKCSMDNMPEMIIELCKEYGINEVRISGNNMYGNKIADEIAKSEKINYSENTINVEVM